MRLLSSGLFRERLISRKSDPDHMSSSNSIGGIYAKTIGIIGKRWRKAYAVVPLRSTYLNLRLSHIFREVADNDFALSSHRWGYCWCSAFRDLRGGLRALLNAAGRGFDGGFSLGGCAAVAHITTGTRTAAGGLGVFHDLVERLVELSRHCDGIGGVVVVWLTVDVVTKSLVDNSSWSKQNLEKPFCVSADRFGRGLRG